MCIRDRFNYVQEKISQIGSYNARETQKIANEYKKSKKLQSKLEKIPVLDGCVRIFDDRG